MRRPSAQSGLAGTLLLLCLVLAVAAGGWWYWKIRKAVPVGYQTLTVTRGEITQAVTATGTLNPVINVEVGSQISGIIKALYVDFNSPVKQGQVIAEIDPATYQATVAQAEGELANAEANLELAQLNEKRARELYERKAAAKSSLDQAVATLHQAEAQVKIRTGALARARVDLERCMIYSPVDGIVISRAVNVGQTVAANFSAPVLFTIANDLARMQINASVAEADVGNVEEGQDVNFTVDAYPSRTFHGKVLQIRNAVATEQNVVTYDTIIEVDNKELKLKPGMTANASIIIAHRDDALKLGAAGLRFRLPEGMEAAASPSPSASPAPIEPKAEPKAEPKGKRRGGHRGGPRNERTVYVLRNGKPEAVTVKTGISDGVFTEVIEGLKEGDEVITGMTGGPVQSGASAAPNPFTGGGMRRRF